MMIASFGTKGAMSGALMALGLMSAVVSAQAADMRAPKGAVELIVGSGAGGSVDILMRRVAQILQDEKIIDQPLVIVNRPGGSWAVGTNFVISKPGDENLLLANSPAQLAGPLRADGSNVYDRMTPIANFIKADLVLVVRPDHPAKDLREMVAMAKEKPRSLKIGGANVGSTDWMGVHLIADAAGVEINYISYEGGAPAIAAFLGGNIDALLLNPDDSLPLAKEGKAKLFAILNDERRTEGALKDIPTAKEEGVNAVLRQQFGVSGPPGLDPAIAAWWTDKFDRASKTAAWKKMVEDGYFGDDYVSGAEIKPFMDDFYNMYKTTFIKLGIIKG